MSYLLLVAAGVLLFLTLWIFIPGWTYPLFVLGVGAPCRPTHSMYGSSDPAVG